jgi:hypothetical protein
LFYFAHIENNLLVKEEKVFEHGLFEQQLSTTVRRDVLKAPFLKVAMTR